MALNISPVPSCISIVVTSVLPKSIADIPNVKVPIPGTVTANRIVCIGAFLFDHRKFTDLLVARFVVNNLVNVHTSRDFEIFFCQ